MSSWRIVSTARIGRSPCCWPGHRYCDAVASTAAGGLSGVLVGREDHVISWTKPKRPAWMDEPPMPSCRHRGYKGPAGVRAPAGIPHPRGPRGNDLVGCPGVPRGGPGKALPGTLACRAGFRSIKQTMQMDVLRCNTPRWCGRRFGTICWSTGCLVRPWPSCSGARSGATSGEPARDAPDVGGLPQPVSADALDCPREYSPYFSECDRQSPRGNPTGPLRATSVQATPETVSPPRGPMAASPGTLGNSRLRLRKRHSPQPRLA